MKQAKLFLILAIFGLSLASCKKEMEERTVDEEIAGGANHGDRHRDDGGNVYALSNEASANRVIVFHRSTRGKLNQEGSFTTGGMGTGMGLGSQGAVVLSDDGDWLLAVNAGSNSISSFKVYGDKLKLKSVVPSGGLMPVSITSYKSLVYVVNAGGTGNISGFRLRDDGTLQPIPHSTRPLTAANAGPAQISFVDDGSAVVITEKNTNKLVSYLINRWGIPGARHTLTSATPTPFGFAVGRHGILYVSEAAGGAPGASTLSSYRVRENGSIVLVDGPNGAGQAAACWVVLTGNGRFVYDTNTGSDNVSSFKTNPFGGLSVLEAVAASTGMGSTPIDAALSKNSKFLYVLNSGNETIRGFSVEGDGGLRFVQDIGGLPDGATGLAAE